MSGGWQNGMSLLAGQGSVAVVGWAVHVREAKFGHTTMLFGRSISSSFALSLIGHGTPETYTGKYWLTP
jgi:hypothetical protein